MSLISRTAARLGWAARFLAVVLVCQAAVQAATITVTGPNPLDPGYISIDAGGSAETAFAGLIEVLVTSGGTSYSGYALCLDLFDKISMGTPYNTTLTNASDPTVSVANLERVSWLVATYLNSAISQTQVQGLQLAVWDIVHDSGDGLAAGTIRSNSATPTGVVAAAGTYEAASLGKSDSTSIVYWTQSGTVQTLISPHRVEAPEPATLALSGIALFGLAAWRRRRIAHA
jgi:hypothetical protein